MDALGILDRTQANLKIMLFVQGELMKALLRFMFYFASILEPKRRQNGETCHLALRLLFFHLQACRIVDSVYSKWEIVKMKAGLTEWRL